jgi:hypothetical protein
MGIGKFVFISVAVAAALLLASCRSGDPIDYETAIALLKDRNTEPVKLTFSASPPSTGVSARAAQAYDQLADAHVLNCESTQSLGKLCQPGPAGDAVAQVGSTELAVVAGRWTPENILSISRSGGSLATAEVRMRFEPSPLYRDFEAAFDQIQLATGKTPLDAAMQSKTVRASYQHYEDGWHLEAVN